MNFICFLIFIILFNFAKSIGRAYYYENGVSLEAKLYNNFIVSIRAAENIEKILCLGTILNRRLILTAAHCVVDNASGKKMDITIIAGTENSDYKLDPNSVLRNVSNIFVHPNFEHKASSNDIAILELNRTVEYHKTNITSVPIADSLPEFPECSIYGWGCSENQTVKFEKLQMKKVFVFDRIKCQKRYGSNFYMNEVCADYFGSLFCANDTGGPVICNDKLIGVVAYIADQETHPNLFMLVSRHIGFIHNPVGMMQFYSMTSPLLLSRFLLRNILFFYPLSLVL